MQTVVARSVSVSGRKKAPQRGSNVFHFAVLDFALHGIDRRHFPAVVEGYFHTITELGKSVEKAAPVELPQMNRTVIWCKHL